jgi:uncharacterized OsmC-like protein
MPGGRLAAWRHLLPGRGLRAFREQRWLRPPGRLGVPDLGAGALSSSANGGELLFLALATCYCNDIYREASKRNLKIERVEVEVEGTFESEGGLATNVSYRVKVTAQASEVEIRELLIHTDRVAEIQNTIRVGTPVTPSGIEVITRRD